MSVQVVRVRRGHEAASWSDGVFAGAPSITGPARFAALVGLEVPVGATTVVAAPDTAVGAIAALLSAGPSVDVVEAPTGVMAELGMRQ